LINAINASIVGFTPLPENFQWAIIDLVIQAKGDITGVAIFASDCGLKAVATLDGELGIGALEVTIVFVLGGEQQAGCSKLHTILQLVPGRF
jgi:hypothetical protein